MSYIFILATFTFIVVSLRFLILNSSGGDGINLIAFILIGLLYFGFFLYLEPWSEQIDVMINKIISSNR